MAAGDATYVYAIARGPLPARMRVLGQALRTVRIGRLAVIAGTAAPDVATPDAVQRQHAVIVELASRLGALLPARFGSALTGAALETAVQDREEELLAALKLVRGRSQMTIRVFGKPDIVDRSAARSSGTAFLESRRARARYEPAEVEVLRHAVGRYAVAERVATGDRQLRATVFHLVPRRAIAAYRRAAAAAVRSLPYRATVTGPWPPFAFAPELI